MADAPPQDPKAWVRVQHKTFKNWANDRLKGTDCQVEDLLEFDDGISLWKLLERLAPDKKKPR